MKILGWLIPGWAYGIAVALALGGAFYSGWQIRDWKCAADEADRIVAEQKAKDRQLAKQHDISAEYETSRETARVEYITREGQVREIYREVEVPSNCAAPPAVRGLLSEAVTSANSATGQPGG